MANSNGNPYRGELLLDLAGTQFRLRPTFQAMASAEGRLGKSLAKVFNDFQENTDLRVGDIAIIVSEFASAAGHPPSDTSLEKVGELVRQEGVIKLFGPIVTLLSVALTGQVLDDNETWLNKHDLRSLQEKGEAEGKAQGKAQGAIGGI